MAFSGEGRNVAGKPFYWGKKKNWRLKKIISLSFLNQYPFLVRVISNSWYVVLVETKRLNFIYLLSVQRQKFLLCLKVSFIFILLGFTPSLIDLLAVLTMLTVSSSIMFIFPQGIGVHEASIAGAFKMLGYSTTLGLSFGLIRRARTIFWVLFGVVLHLGYVFFSKKKASAVTTK